jgi:alpha-ketoglutarate-dependent taurine dioxygenase
MKDLKKSFLQREPSVRKAISSDLADSVEVRQLAPVGDLPLLLRPRFEELDLVAWIRDQRSFVEDWLLKHGGILFRGFKLRSLAQFEEAIRAASGPLLGYNYRSTPRKNVSDKIYTSTEYPKDQFIPFHNEMAYSNKWPLRIWFHSIECAASGGETPIADSRRVYRDIDRAIRDRFAAKGVMYVRNYGEGMDLPWQEVFQTESREKVEEYCRDNGIGFEWVGSKNLRTREVCPAIACHPKTGDSVWFNQAHLFHTSALPPGIRQALEEAFEPWELPRNALYGDGSPMIPAELDHIREVYEKHKVVFSWQEGDILALDNMLTAHARHPFTGSRKVVVGMAEQIAAIVVR